MLYIKCHCGRCAANRWWTCASTCWHTAVRRDTSAFCVAAALALPARWLYIWECTRENGRLAVPSAQDASQHGHIWRCTWGNTLARSRTAVCCAERSLSGWTRWSVICSCMTTSTVQSTSCTHWTMDCRALATVLFRRKNLWLPGCRTPCLSLNRLVSWSIDGSPFLCGLLCYLYSLVKMDCGVLFNLVSFYVFLQCFDTVGWVIWPVKTRPHMTYNVFGGTLSLTQSINPHQCLSSWPRWTLEVMSTKFNRCKRQTLCYIFQHAVQIT